MIYSSECYQQDHLESVIGRVISDHDELASVKIMSYPNAKVVVGWSHSFIFSSVLNENERDEILDFYCLPFKLGWGEYEFMVKQISNIDKLIYNSYAIFEKKSQRHKTRKYKKNTDKLYFFIDRVIDTFDGSSITLNRTQQKLISVIKSQWEIDSLRTNYDKNMASLKELVSYISDLQKSNNSRLLNGILFSIATLSTIDISNTLYDTFINGLNRQLLFSTAPITTIFVVTFLFVRLSQE